MVETRRRPRTCGIAHSWDGTTAGVNLAFVLQRITCDSVLPAMGYCETRGGNVDIGSDTHAGTRRFGFDACRLAE
jgi:hypothetical protein